MSNKKKDYIYNIIAGLINAAETVVMAMIVARITSIEDAGIITIGFALANLFTTIGKFGIRNFQITDIENEYSFSEYLIFRCITTLLMMLVSTTYLIVRLETNVYSAYKFWSILLLMAIFAIESIEDVFWGELQKNGYLYKGAFLFIARWISIFISFGIVIAWKHSLVPALLSAFFISLIVFISRVYSCRSNITSLQNAKINKNIIRLLCVSSPLFLVMFLQFYLNNAPKYALDIVAGDTVQACYSFVIMPVFCTSLFTSFFYQPILVELANEWKEKSWESLRKKVKRQFILIAAFTAVIVLGALLAGIPVLSFLFNTNLQEYKLDLIILMVASGFIAVNNFLGTLLNALRRQKAQMIVFIVISLLSLILMKPVAIKYGTIGISLLFMILMSMISLCYGILCYNKCKQSL